MNAFAGMELLLIAFGVSMDAFAVAISKGLSLKDSNIKKALIVGLYFGSFQAGMSLLGYFLGVQFYDYVNAIDHWVAFFLLGSIGFNMIKESLGEDGTDDSLDFKSMGILAIATSIDALAAGVSLACLNVNIVNYNDSVSRLLVIASSAFFIGIVTFIFSVTGVKIGSRYGEKYKSKAEMFGGMILLIVAIKTLLEHFGFLKFLPWIST